MLAYHKPVMLSTVIDYLRPCKGGVILDCTLGTGGHALEIVKRIGANGTLIGIDRDADALYVAEKRLAVAKAHVILKKGNFADLEVILRELGIPVVDGVLFDLGVGSHQLDNPERGFSFRYNAVLDMRMDKDQSLTAKEVVNSFPESRLAEILWNYGEERWGKQIAKLIVERRERKPIETTWDLVDVVLAAVPPRAISNKKIHPASRVFLALRSFVNRERESLQAGLDAAIHMLEKGGIICVLSYQSLEDRVVKQTYRRYAGKCVCPPDLPVCVCAAERSVRILTKKPVTPSEEEIREHPEARSAKLRVAEKL